jgi:hypothetical protein
MPPTRLEAEAYERGKREERERIREMINEMRRENVEITPHGYVYKTQDVETVCKKLLAAITKD